ncbi:MAG TPA: nitrate- and nitrite sensing domain-containing protein [Planosporangium sp.]|jgi:signal transduction histidine kinase|nr:nitrate- and nitrite sensing domain-containing protein [Planosporangium sp.]
MAIATTPQPRPSAGQHRSLTADPAITGHRRGGRPRLWSVRTQLLAPILIAMLGLGVLGTQHTSEAIDSARDAGRAQVVASTATATVRLTHELERELAETVALRQRGGRAGEQLVIAQRTRTDQALGRYRAARASAVRTAPALEAQLNAADVQLDKLDMARSQSNAGTLLGTQTDQAFRDMADALLAVADALPLQLRDPDLASAARAVAALAAVEHFHALERDLLRIVFSRGSLQGGELLNLARFESARQQREAEFARVADAAARQDYDRIVTGPDVEKAAQRRSAVFDGEPGALKADADTWYVVQSGTIRKLNVVGLGLSDALDRRAAEVSASATRRAWTTALGTVGLGLTALTAGLVLAVRTSRRLRRLRAAALTVAHSELPDTIAKVMAGSSVEQSIGTESQAADVTRRIAASDDEVGEVADAFSSVHHTALRLASDQAELYVDVARMAEIFARRIRTLITRQLRLLDEFERDETDPEALSRFFALDHLAARLRRNGENLLVLAGGEPGRPATGAFPLGAVITAAASEIEDFERVEAQPMEAAVAGPVVGDLVHLLAELLENAARFSPPDTPVRVDARHTIDGVVVRVHDSGIGLTEVRLAEVNVRLAERARLSSAAAGTMGLYVVAHLAARHGITVQLHATATGTVAYVLLPLSVLAPGTVIRGAASESARSAPVLQGPGGRSARITAAALTTWFRPDQQDAHVTAGTGAAPADAGMPRVGTGDAAVGAGAPHPGAGQRVPSALPPAPSTPTVRASAIVPASGAPTERSPGTEPRQEGTVDTTPPREADGELPRRRPGAQFTGAASPVMPAPARTAPVDPDVVRTRLSALAEGVSAALRHSNQSTPAAKDR